MHICRIGVGAALIVLIRGIPSKAHVIATSYLYLVLQNCEDFSIKQNIDLVSTVYHRPPNSTWLERVKRILKQLKIKCMHFSKLVVESTYHTGPWLSRSLKINSDVDVVKI